MCIFFPSFFSVTLKDAETEKLNVSLLCPHVIEHGIFAIFLQGEKEKFDEISVRGCQLRYVHVRL